MRKLILTFSLLLMFGLVSFGQTQTLVDVAKKHYTDEDIKQLKDVDIEKINFYYTQSFEIDSASYSYRAFIDRFCSGSFDITVFDNYRQKENRNWFASEEFPNFKITLFSIDEIKVKYNQIENKYK